MTKCGSREAWCETLKRVMKREASFPAENLKPVLFRYNAWQASASALEQNFSKSDYFNSTGRSGASEEFESRSVRLLCGNFDKKLICIAAQKLYSECGSGFCLECFDFQKFRLNQILFSEYFLLVSYLLRSKQDGIEQLNALTRA